MTQLMEEIGPVRVRLDFDCNDTQDNVIDLLEEIAPYSGSISPQESEQESKESSEEVSEGEEEEGEEDQDEEGEQQDDDDVVYVDDGDEVEEEEGDDEEEEEEGEEEEEEGEEEETNQESVQSRESTGLFSSIVQKVNPAPSDWIVLQSRVAQLETDLTISKRAAKRARIEEETVSSKPPTDEELSKRVHDLERERNKVMEELLLLKIDLKSAQDELSEKTKQFHTEEHNTSVELRKLQAELIQAQSDADSCRAEKDYYASRYEISEDKHKIEIAALNQTCSQYQDHIKELTAKVNSLQLMEQELFTAKMTINHLEREKRVYNSDAKLVQIMRTQINEHDGLSRLNAKLIDENKILRETSCNVELLRYQSLTLEEKIGRFESMEAELAKLKLENQDLRKRFDQWCGSDLAADPVAMQRHISELQQRDVMNISQVKELETKLKSLTEENSSLKSELDSLKSEIGAQKAKIKSMEEVAMRRERRLTFLTKERDGYINVLKSYQLDGTVDQQIKELQAELVKCQAASNDVIKQLEEELEKLKPAGEC